MVRPSRVLLIDDDEMIAESFRILLEDRGVIVDVSRNLRSALDHRPPHQFDVVFVDPFMSGTIPFVPRDTIARLRTVFSEAMLVVITWYGTEDLQEGVRAATPASLLQKPQSIMKLAELVDRNRALQTVSA
jgi:DNA-binding NtrC family response regulator